MLAWCLWFERKLMNSVITQLLSSRDLFVCTRLYIFVSPQTSCLIWFTNESSYLTLKYSENKLPRMPGTFHAGTISVCPFVQSNIWIFHIWEKTTTKKHSTCTDLLKLYGKIQITMFYYSAFLMKYKKKCFSAIDTFVMIFVKSFTPAHFPKNENLPDEAHKSRHF